MTDWDPHAYLDRVKTLLHERHISLYGRPANDECQDLEAFAQRGMQRGATFVDLIERVFGAEAELGASFVSGFARAAKGLAVASSRATKRGYISEPVVSLDSSRQDALLSALLDRYCALNGTLGLTRTALERTPVLYATAPDVHDVARRHPSRTASVISHIFLYSRTEPARAARALERNCEALAGAFPTLPASVVEHLALHNPDDPIQAATTFVSECESLRARFPDIQRSTVEYFALRHPDEREPAIRRMLARRDRVHARFPDLTLAQAERFARGNPGTPISAAGPTIAAARVRRAARVDR